MTAREAPFALLAAASASRIISFIFRLRAAASITVPWLIAWNVFRNFSGFISWFDAMAGDLSARGGQERAPGAGQERAREWNLLTSPRRAAQESASENNAHGAARAAASSEAESACDVSRS